MTTNNIDTDPYSNLFTTECSQTFNITPYPWQVAVGGALIQASLGASFHLDELSSKAMQHHSSSSSIMVTEDLSVIRIHHPVAVSSDDDGI